MFRALADVSFEHLITRRLIGVVYAVLAILTLVAGTVAALGFILNGGALILVGLVAVPVVTLLQLLVLRVAVESVVVYFRLAEDVRALRDRPAPGSPVA
jgi:fumarate reductase subunit C